MRLKLRPDPKDIPFGTNIGDERTVTRFLWTPKQIKREWRWLETASWIERVTPHFYVRFPLSDGPDLATDTVLKWESIKWVDDQPLGLLDPRMRFIPHEPISKDVKLPSEKSCWWCMGTGQRNDGKCFVCVGTGKVL